MSPVGSDAEGDRPEQELEELKFLVGTACSRAINLLMQPAPDRAELQDEMAFLGAKASRLAELLAHPLTKES